MADLPNESRNILITGGAGFIGSNLCKYLKKSNHAHHILCLDNYLSGSVANHIEDVTYIRGSCVDIDKHIDFKPDWIFHLGEYSRVEQSLSEPDLVWTNNILGTKAVVDFALKTNAKLIYAGSSTKFGDGGANKNQTPYAWTKSSNTELVSNYSDWFGLNSAIVYFYNAYGPGEIEVGKYATLIAKFTRAMRDNKPLTVVAPGTQRRNFTHVADIVSGLHHVAQFGTGDGFGIGHPDSFSIIDVAEMFGGAVEYLPERRGNRMTAEVKTAKTLELGWLPQNDLQTYIAMLKGSKWIQPR